MLFLHAEKYIFVMKIYIMYVYMYGTHIIRVLVNMFSKSMGVGIT